MNNAKEYALVGILAALYAVMTIIPFSAYIGGPGFITASCFLIPVIAWLLSPRYALLTGFIGGLIATMFGMGYGMAMPFFGMLIPAFACGMGSLAFRKQYIVPMIYLILEGCFYWFSYNGQASPMFLIHYLVAIALGLLAMGAKDKSITTVGSVALTAMAENATLNVGSIMVLALPAELWAVIAPVSILERLVILIVGSLLIGILDRSEYVKELVME